MRKFYQVLFILIVGFSNHGIAKTIYVNLNPPQNGNDGKAWISAYKSLQSALDAAVSGDQIWVAKGTYKPSSAYSLTNTSRYYHFEMKEGVAIYGGFSGSETTTADRTNFGVGKTNETILSGDIGTVGKNTDNCYHVIYNSATLALTNAAVIDGFTITGGYAYTSPSYLYGGGMYNCSSSPTLVNITFISNSATYGGAISNLNSSPVLINVAIISNNAGHGSGMYNLSSSPILNNVTIAANTAAGNGGGIYNKSSSPVFNNSIIWGNLAGTANQIYNESGTVALNYSCYANAPGDITNTGTLTATNNNTTSNPMFYNAMASDCRLTANSPCLDAGLNSYNSQTYDIRGKGYSRKLLKSNASVAGTIDMGAYEYMSGECTTKKIYVNASASGSNNGTTWGNAYTSLQTAIVNANFGDVIWVTKGTYKPSSAYSLTNTSRYYHFEMKEGVAIYGGFAGTETTTSERTNFGYGQTNETILSGDVGTLGSSADNCYHVIYNPGSLTSAAIIDGFTITGGNANDLSHYHGGGMCNNSNGSPTISNVVFIANYGNNGGGMFNYNGSSPKLHNVSFISNSSKHGGGMYNWMNSSPVLTNAKFISNTSLGEGGAISSVYGAQVTITNGIIASNTAVKGGGIDCGSNSTLTLTNVTIAANTATDDAGGVCCNSSATFNNCILWGNTSQNLFQDMDIFSGNTVAMNYSCYSTKLYDIGNVGTFTITNHNVTTSPVFADAEHGDFRIKKVSPCVNAGYDDYNSLTTDVRGAGYGRKIGTIDMGAYEYNSIVDTDVDVVIKYVNAEATTGGNNGTTWVNAYTSLQTALENANAGDQIWVAKGTYKPSSAYDLTNESRYFHFRMKADVAIYGGFEGTEARSYDLKLRDFKANETILSGDLGTQDYYPDNCYHVIYNPATSALASTAVLDGFTVTGGDANGTHPHNNGAGMYNNSCSPTLSNLIFIGNTAVPNGYGAGIYNDKSLPRLTNVAFTSNQASSGGGLYNTQSSVILTNVSFTNNWAEYAGGGLYSYNGSSVTLTNCTFTYNDAGSNGGGMFHYDGSSPVLNNVTFNLNEADKGGGLYLIGNTPVLNNCIIWGNHSGSFGDEIYLKSNCTASLNYCCFPNLDNDIYAELGSSFTFDDNTITDDPKFVDVSKGDCRISDGSSCIDKGNNSYNSTSTDFRGQARVQNSTIDIGAYEWTDGLDFICTNPTDGGEIAATQHICKGNKPEAFKSVSLPTGHKGILEYQWQLSTTSETEGFSDIVGANNTTYTPSTLVKTTWFRRLARVSCMDNWEGATASNVVAVEVVVVTNPFSAIEKNEFTYDGTEKAVVININDDETIEWYDDDFNFFTNLSGTNAGTYSLYPVVSNVDYGCALDNFKAISLVINKAEIKVTPDAIQSKAYGDADPVLSYSYSPQLAEGNSFIGSLSRDAGENAGVYDITTGTLDAGKNYSITLATGTFVITPKAIFIIPDASQSKVYGENDPAFTYLASPLLVGSDKINGTLSRTVGENVGKYPFSIGTLNAGGNYVLTLIDADFTIGAKTVTVTPHAKQFKIYGESDPDFTYTYAPDLVAGDALSGKLTRVAGEDAGNYAISAGTLDAGENYHIEIAEVDFTIETKPVTVIIDANQTKVYGEPDPVFTYAVTPSLLSSDAFVGSLSRQEGENAGAYTMTIGTLSAGNNYIVSLTNADFAITSKPVTITPNDNQSKVYGDSDPEFTFSVTPSLIGSDKITGSLIRHEGENVGNYAFSTGTLDAGSNYKVTVPEAVFSIIPKPITITPDAKSKVYGDADPIFTYTYSPSITEGDIILGEPGREEGENAGNYSMTLGTLSAGNNYELKVTGVDFIITPRIINVSADMPKSKVYGDTDPELTYTTVPSLINDDSFSGKLSRSQGENVGIYPVEAGTLTAGANYKINFTGSDFEITAKQLSISDPVVTLAKQYDGTSAATIFPGILTGLLKTDEGNITVTATGNFDNASIGTGKTITVIYLLNGSGAGNYVAPKDYTVTGGSISDKITLTGLSSLEQGCEGSSFELAFNILSGDPVQYKIVFGELAIKAGFANNSYAALPISAGAGNVTIDIPDGTSHGTYQAHMQLRNTAGAESELFPFTFTIGLSSDFLVEKFDDVILCNNTSRLFTAYQWFKNNTMLDGATNQFYCDPKGRSGTYYVQVTTTDGNILKTCPVTYNTLPLKSAINVYPNPVKSGQPFTIEITGANESDLEGAVMQIYNVSGTLKYRSTQVKDINRVIIDGQFGNYIIRINSVKGKSLEGKILMEKL